MYTYFKYALTLTCLFTTGIYAQSEQQLDEVVITDTRFSIPRINSGKTVIKLTKKDIEPFIGQSLGILLNAQSGIHISGSTNHGGQVLSSFIRGGNNRQVLVIVDGVPVNDPAQIESNFDLRLISLSDIESIEILKGASSSLYGSTAATAVINIKTSKAYDNTMHFDFETHVGTNNAYGDSSLKLNDVHHYIRWAGGLESVQYSIALSKQTLEGMSAVKGEEDDPVERLNYNIQLSSNLTKKLKLNASIQKDNFETSYDDAFGFQDADNVFIGSQQRISLRPRYALEKGELSGYVSWSETQREFISSYPSESDAKSVHAEFLTKHQLFNNVQGLLGVQYQKQKAVFAEIEIVDPFFNLVYISEFGLQTQIGARLNTHNQYDSQWTFHINPSYIERFKGGYLKLLTNYSTSYISPSLYKLYSSSYGNSNLVPEENRTFEVGVELGLSDQFRLGALFFDRKEENFVDFVAFNFDPYMAQYRNTPQDFKIRGVEIDIDFSFSKELSIKTNYTFTEKVDQEPLRLPKHMTNASLSYRLGKKTNLTFNYQFKDSRYDNNASFTRTELSSYSLFDFYLNHQLPIDGLKVSVAMTNIFDKEFTELYGFNTRGRNFRLGVLYNL